MRQTYYTIAVALLCMGAMASLRGSGPPPDVPGPAMVLASSGGGASVGCVHLDMANTGGAIYSLSGLAGSDT